MTFFKDKNLSYVQNPCIIDCPKDLTLETNKFCLARLKDMQTRKINFYCIFDKIELN